MNPVYKTFSTLKNHYLYDRSTNSIVKLEKEEFDRLNEKDEEMILRFREKNYLADNTIERIRHPNTDYLEYYLSNNLEQLIIQLTQNCNLRCDYCPYMGGYDNRVHADKVIGIETIRKGIDYLFAHSQNAKKITVAFYGGEPLLEMSLLKKAVDYIEETKEGRKVNLTLTTNGTLLTNDKVKYLMEKNIRVLISLDGAREYHDANRVFPNGKGSFDTIMEKLKEIKQSYPQFYLRMGINSVISPNNDLTCTNNFFNADQVLEQLGVNMSLVNEYNAKFAIRYDESFAAIHNFEICKVYLNMLGKISEQHVSKLYQRNTAKIHDLYMSFKPYKMQVKESHPSGPCLPGVFRLFMDVDGNFYPCERVSEQSEIMRIGHVDKGIDLEKTKYLLNVGAISEQKCIDCFAFNLCKVCCSSCDGNTELSKDKKNSICSSIQRNALDDLKTIAMLKEFNYRDEE